MNLFKPSRTTSLTETFDTLLQLRNVTIERIHSPPGTRSQLLLQQQDEWVCLLRGEALLEVGEESIKLYAGETLLIPAETPHRVLSTSADPTCIWLAVHIR